MPGPEGSEVIRVRSGAAAWREVEGEAIVLELASSRYLGANQSGTILWSALSEGTTREKMIDRLIQAYGIDQERSASAVDAFVAVCRARGLLEP